MELRLDIEVKQFKELLRTPKLVLTGLLSQFILLPALTYFFVLWVKPPPSIALGLFLVAACPGGNVSNFMSHLAKANSALSITLTAFATLLSVIMTPLNFQWYASLYEPTAVLLRSISVDPADLFKVVGLLLVASFDFRTLYQVSIQGDCHTSREDSETFVITSIHRPCRDSLNLQLGNVSKIC